MTIKVKLAAIAKDEAAYIPQWIHHHLLFGFHEIEIWLNNTTDNSVEMLSAIQKVYGDKVVRFRNADKLLKRCLSENLQFQQLAYADIYYETLERAEFTHILFLDLDEFWAPENFTSSITDFINSTPDFDAVSFQWFIDTPNPSTQLFAPPFSFVNTLQKNRHVKTLTKLTSKMTELSVHNHVITDGVYRLATGVPFPGTQEETIHKSLVPLAALKTQSNKVEKAFILHQINRTSVEYLSSLLRGRGHKNDTNIFKVNRIGYLLDNHSLAPSIFKVGVEKIARYNDSLARFTARLSSQLTPARNFVIARFFAAAKKIADDPGLLATYRDQLRGVRLNDLLGTPLPVVAAMYSIDKVSLVGTALTIEGWAFDILSEEQPVLSLNTKDSSKITFKAQKVNRHDVVRVHADARVDCGFMLTATGIIDGNIELIITSSGGVQKCNISIAPNR